MSWILGCLSDNLSSNLKAKFSNLHPSSLHRVINSNLFVYAGGISQTCLKGALLPSVTNSSSGEWIVCGLGIRLKNDHCVFLTSSEWQTVLSAAQPSFKGIDGHFVALRWHNGRCEIFSDQLGLRTIYIAQGNYGVVFSTRLDWVTGIHEKATLNYEVLAGYWLTFNQLTYESPLHGILRLGPGGHAQLTPNSINVHNTIWRPVGQKATSEEFYSRIRAFTNPSGDFRKLALGLSGGLDSRVLLALTAHKRNDFFLYTFGNINDPDVQIASRIAASEGLSHLVLNDPIPNSTECIDLMRSYAAETCLCEPATSILRLRYYKKLHSSGALVIDGGFGELSRRQYLNRLLLKGKSALQSGDPESITPHLSVYRASIFTEEIIQTMRNGLHRQVRSVLDEMPPISEIGIENYLDLFAIRTRVPNWGGLEQARMDSQIMNYMPFVQPSLLQLVFALSVPSRANGRLFRRLIRQQRNTLTRLPLVKVNTTYPFSLGPIGSWLWTKAKSRLKQGFLDNTRYDVLDRVKDFTLDTMNSTSVKNFDAYNHSSIMNLLASYYKGNRNLAAQVDWWLTFELWRQSVGPS